MEAYKAIALSLGLLFEGVQEGPKYNLIGFQGTTGSTTHASFYVKSTEVSVETVKAEYEKIQAQFASV